MIQLQKDVQEFLEDNSLDCSIEHRLLDLISELGEVSKEILKASKYGKEPIALTSEFGEELGDLQFSLLALASKAGIDLDAVTKAVLEKYQNRIQLKGHPGST